MSVKVKGEKIMKLRKEAGLSRRELSERSGVSKKTIQDWEEENRSKKEIDLELLIKVLKTMKASLKDVVENADELRLRQK
jgi:transcriptional regulator with XRE-family HTH domain